MGVAQKFRRVEQIIWLMLVVVFSGLVSCQKAQSPHHDEFQMSVDRLIDNQEYDLAIEKLKENIQGKAYKTEEQRERWLVTLSSAYIGKAGLSIDRFYELAESFQNQRSKGIPFLRVPLEQLLAKVKESSSEQAVEVASILRDVYLVLELIDNVVIRFQTLPNIDEKSRVYLLQALELLRTETSLNPGSRLFKILIETVLVKNKWQFGDYEVEDLQFESLHCDVDLESFLKVFKEFARDIDRVVADISKVFPEESGQYSKFSKTLNGIEDVDTSKIDRDFKALSSSLFILLLQFSPNKAMEFKCAS